MLSQPDCAFSGSARANQILELTRKLMEYRSHDIAGRLEKLRRRASMLHLDVLLLIYHFAKFGCGNVLEIGSYLGGSTIAAALGARESQSRKKIVTIEVGGQLKHLRIPSKNIIRDLKKNLTRFGVFDDIKLISGASFDQGTISSVRETLTAGDVGLFIFDADSNVRRDLNTYGDLLRESCWVVIDDYFGAGTKAAPIQAHVDELVLTGRLLPFGYYGWGTWIGQWRAK